MRKLIVLVFLCTATSVFAQQNKPNALSFFVTNPGGGTSDNRDDYQGAFGFALQHMFAPRLSGEVAVSSDVVYTRTRTFLPDGTVASTGVLTTRTTPWDITGRYHFLNGSNWKPYIGVNTRLVDSRAFFGINGGVVWQFRPVLGLRIDSKLLVSDRPRHNERLYNSIGLSWRF